MGSTYTTNLHLRKPGHKDPDTRNQWGGSIDEPGDEGVLNINFNIIDLAVGPRSYTEENYILNDEPLSESLDKLDVKLQEVETSVDATSLIEVVLFPEYPGATFSQSPGGLNTGQFTTDSEMQSNNRFNFYEWLSEETVLNNYDILVQWKVPSTFIQWTEVENKALVIDIKTDTDSTADNNIEIELQKDGVDSYSPSGPFTSTVGGEWNSDRFDNELVFFDQTDAVLASISAGDVLNIRITLSSKDGNKARVGPITLRYLG